jgi:tRNA wybutosine-synthesizing protein 1
MAVWSESLFLSAIWSYPNVALLSAVVALLSFFWVFYRPTNISKDKEKQVKSDAGIGVCEVKNVNKQSYETQSTPHSLSIFYGTQTGTAKVLAEQVFKDVTSLGLRASVTDLSSVDPEQCLTQQCAGGEGGICVFLLSTYTDGGPPDSAAWFTRWLADTAADFRVHKSLLKGMHYAVFGLGNSLYTQHYNTAGRELYRHLQQLSAQPVHQLGLGDQNVAQSKYGGKL